MLNKNTIRRKIAAIWLHSRDVFDLLRIVRMPLAMTVLAALVFILPEQTREVYRANIQYALFSLDDDIWPKLELVFSLLGILVAAVSVWYVAKVLLERLGGELPLRLQGLANRTPRILAVVVMLAAAVGVFMARTPKPGDEVEAAAVAALDFRFNLPDEAVAQRLLTGLLSFNDYLLWGAVMIATVGIALAAVLPNARFSPAEVGVETPHAPLFGRKVGWLVAGAVFALLAVFVASPVTVPQTLGTVAILCLFIACMTIVLGQLSYLADRTRLPFTFVLLFFAIALSLLDLNDNHTVYRERTSPATIGDAPARPPAALKDEFQTWWNSRAAERARFATRGQPFPIYVVAAQGGGIYAAAHVTNTLSAIQHVCPAFVRHLFAISGVSGGSVGAATFAGLLKQTVAVAANGPADPACHGKAPPYKNSLMDLGEQVLNEDLLSPLIGALTFPDLIQRFIPYPIDSFDRALRLEKAFEDAMDAVAADLVNAGEPVKLIGPNFLSSRYTDHWKADGNMPALLFNTTEVGSGRRRVIAPFEFSGRDLLLLPFGEQFPRGHMAAKINDLPVSTAALLSARFPWITPAGTFHDFPRNDDGTRMGDGAPRRERLVDGGYFENSGVATALDLVRALEEAADKGNFAQEIKINLIVLTRGTFPQQEFYGLNEAISPIQALLSTRTSRAYITIAEAKSELDGRGDQPLAGARDLAAKRLRKVDLLDMSYPPPLGWRLSPITMLLIQAQNGIKGNCTKASEQSNGPLSGFDADCLMQAIVQELRD